MLTPRTYTVSFAATATTTTVDFFELITGTSGKIVLLGIDIGQTTELGDAAEEQLRWYVRRLTGSYTSGSGGNTGVARVPVDPSDSAATFTAETFNTTPAVVGSGALLSQVTSVFNLRSGLEKIWTPETAPMIGISSAITIGLAAAPADSVTFEGTAYVGELSP